MRNTDQLEDLTSKHAESSARFAEMLAVLGLEFERRRRILDYRPDFYFPKLGDRIIEIDARKLLTQDNALIARQKHLKKYGYRVMRIRASDVLVQPEWLMHRVLMFLKVPHAPVSRAFRVRKKKATKALKNTPAWAKVARLSKDHLMSSKDWTTRSAKQEAVKFEPSKSRPIKVIKKQPATATTMLSECHE